MQPERRSARDPEQGARALSASIYLNDGTSGIPFHGSSVEGRVSRAGLPVGEESFPDEEGARVEDRPFEGFVGARDTGSPKPTWAAKVLSLYLSSHVTTFVLWSSPWLPERLQALPAARVLGAVGGASGLLALAIGFGFWWNYFDFARTPKSTPRAAVPRRLDVRAPSPRPGHRRRRRGMVGLVDHAGASRTPEPIAWLIGGATAVLAAGLATLLASSNPTPHEASCRSAWALSPGFLFCSQPSSPRHGYSPRDSSLRSSPSGPKPSSATHEPASPSQRPDAPAVLGVSLVPLRLVLVKGR